MTAGAAPVVRYWDDRARRGYDEQPGQRPVRDVWAERISPLVADAVGNGARVLDSGCGTGFLAGILAAAGHRVTGQDVSSGMLEVAAENAAQDGVDVEWIAGTAAEPPEGPFDVVMTRNVLWTLPEPGCVLHAWRRVLRPGGLLLISDALWGSADNGEPNVRQRFDASYSAERPSLPLMDGLDFATCAELVTRADFTDVTEHTARFPTVPYPSAPGFFVLSARAPR